VQGYTEWHDPAFQSAVVERMQRTAYAAGRRFGIGPEAFAWLAEIDSADGNPNGSGILKKSIASDQTPGLGAPADELPARRSPLPRT
jgi:hypothetical protein